MIRFRCSCGQLLEAPESLAGDALQCPNCGRLRSVPELEELAHLEDDGTIRFVDPPAPPPRMGPVPPAGAERHRTVSPSPAPTQRVRYDPETGEAVLPLDLAEAGRWDSSAPPVDTPQRPPTSAPVAAPVAAPAGESRGSPRTLNYAGSHTPSRRRAPGEAPPMVIRTVHWYTIPLELFQPANALVLGIVFAAHLLLQLFGVLVAIGILPLALIAIGFYLLILAHFGNVLDETGWEGRDELPAMLRDVSFMDDIWLPLWRLLLAGTICFGPSLALARAAGLGPFAGVAVPDTPTVLAAIAAFVLGIGLFPAVWLTVSTSGTLLNLLPHRVLGLIAACGGKYVLAVALLPVAVAFYAVGMLFLFDLTFYSQYGSILGVALSAPVSAIIAYPSLIIGIYLLHAFAWLLGKLYQQHHAQFPWVLQRHVSTRTDAVKQMERERAAKLRAEREARAREVREAREARSSVQPGLATRP